MTLTDRELGIVTDEVYDSINDAHEHGLMHIVYIYLDFFNEYGGHYEWSGLNPTSSLPSLAWLVYSQLQLFINESIASPLNTMTEAQAIADYKRGLLTLKQLLNIVHRLDRIDAVRDT